MSTETIRGVPVRDWQGSTSDDADTDMLDGAFKYVGEAGSSDVEPGVSVDE